MQTRESKGIVRRTIEEKGGFSVSFANHACYFLVPPSEHMDDLKKKILEAQQNKKEIAFVFDKKLNILKIL
jgi:hypothetical protein